MTKIICCKLYNKICIFGKKKVHGGEERRNATKERKEKGKKGKGEKRKRQAQVDVIEEKNKFEGNKEKSFWREKR